MSRLLEKGLVIGDEKLEFGIKQEVDHGMKEVDSGGSGCNPKTEVVKAIQMQPCRNPLEIAPVIKHVFQYLDTENVKQLRLVTKEWASVGLVVLFTRTPIILESERNIRRFLYRFRRFSKKSSYGIVPFRKFTFLGKEDELWSVDKLENFIKKQGKYITELKFKDLQLVDNCTKKILETCNINSWIANCAMAKQWKTKCNSKLSASCQNSESTNLVVDLSALNGIKELSLKNVTVNLQDGIRISPTKIKLSDVVFMEDGDELCDVYINDVLNFSMLNYLSLNISEDPRPLEDKTLSLELLGDGKLEHLKILSNVELINFTSCRWSVNNLTTCNKALLICTQESEMQIKHLIFVSEDRVIETKDMAKVPLCLEKLSIVGIDEDNFLYSGRRAFENIKFLHLYFVDRSLPVFTDIFKFPILTHLSLESWKNTELDLALIPKTVKVLSLTRMKIVNAGNDHLSLDTLIIRLAKAWKVGEFCLPGFRTKELVLDFSWKRRDKNLEATQPVQAAVDVLEHQNACRRDCVQRFYIGPFPWHSRQFDSSPLRFYANGQANYYLFENEKGKPIEWKAVQKEDFYSRADLNTIYDKMKL